MLCKNRVSTLRVPSKFCRQLRLKGDFVLCDINCHIGTPRRFHIFRFEVQLVFTAARDKVRQDRLVGELGPSFTMNAISQE